MATRKQIEDFSQKPELYGNEKLLVQESGSPSGEYWFIDLNDLSNYIGNTLDIPVSRALSPASAGADLSALTVGASGYLFDSLDFDGTESQSAFFSFTAPPSMNTDDLDIDVFVSSTASDSDTAKLDVGLMVINASVDLTGTVRATTSHAFTLSSANDVQAHTFSVTSVNISGGDIVNLKFSRDTDNDTATEDLSLLKITLRW